MLLDYQLVIKGVINVVKELSVQSINHSYL